MITGEDGGSLHGGSSLVSAMKITRGPGREDCPGERGPKEKHELIDLTLGYPWTLMFECCLIAIALPWLGSGRRR